MLLLLQLLFFRSHNITALKQLFNEAQDNRVGDLFLLLFAQDAQLVHELLAYAVLLKLR